MLPKAPSWIKGGCFAAGREGERVGKGMGKEGKGIGGGERKDGRDEGRGKGDRRNGMEGERRGWAGGKGKGGEGLHPKLQFLVPPLNAIRNST